MPEGGRFKMNDRPIEVNEPGGHTLVPEPDFGQGAAGTDLLVTIGDVGCTQTEVITPGGVYPLKDTSWIVKKNYREVEKIPTYAIVLAIVFAIACLIGLLFLLIKEHKLEGFVEVDVQGPNLFYATQIPVSNLNEVVDIEQRVNYARGLVRSLP
jgi:hypothetical protein